MFSILGQCLFMCSYWLEW